MIFSYYLLWGYFYVVHRNNEDFNGICFHLSDFSDKGKRNIKKRKVKILAQILDSGQLPLFHFVSFITVQ